MTETESMPSRKANGAVNADTITTNGNGDHKVAAPARVAAEPPTAPRITPDVAPGKPFYRKTPFVVFFVLIFLGAIGAGIYFLHARHFESTDDAFIDGHIIPISPQVSALVKAVNVLDNQLVHKGDLLVELDPTDFQVALAQAQGAEASARGKLEQAKSNVEAAQSAVNVAQAELDSAHVMAANADRDWQRMQSLSAEARSQQQEDNAQATQKNDAAQVAQAQASLVSAQTQVKTIEASVIAAQGDYEKAQADTQRARINLGYCQIVAPEDGRITTKAVEPGMYVTPSTQLFSIVPPQVWVVANFKETQLDLMRPGQKVRITVDAYPDQEFQGTVESIQAGTGSRFSVIPAENATGNFVKVVQRIPVKILIDGETNADSNRLLSPGMSVEPTVRVSEGEF